MHRKIFPAAGSAESASPWPGCPTSVDHYTDSTMNMPFLGRPESVVQYSLRQDISMMCIHRGPFLYQPLHARLRWRNKATRMGFVHSKVFHKGQRSKRRDEGTTFTSEM